MRYDTLKNHFLNPPPEYRSVPFWGWNYKPAPKELESQVLKMKEQGLGGFFIHAREGLEVTYLGKDWMECVKTAVESADKEGLSAWIYDEDRWPSGFAGGLAAQGGDDYRAKAITVEVRDCLGTQDNSTIAVFAVRASGRRLLSCERITKYGGSKVNGGHFLIFRREVSGPRPWFNNEAPPDNLNEKAVRRFIDITYEAYFREAGGHFGKTIPGFFTDEPHFAERQSAYPEERGWIPYTDGFEQYFFEKRGTHFFDILPYIFYESESSEKARHDYWRTLTEKFAESYSAQIAKWCDEKGAQLTGHYISESDLGLQIRLGGAVMPQLRHMHMPGVDILCEQAGEYMTLKQCTSISNQFSRKRTLTEVYAASGYAFTFEAQKWTTDWQYALGANFRCQSALLYTLKGCAKRDYPPVFGYNVSWWEHDFVVEDYYARLSAVLSEGRVIRDALVIHPASSGWTMMGAGIKRKDMSFQDEYTDVVDAYGRKTESLIRCLLGEHYDFDFGDEIIIEENAAVEGNTFYVNKAGYKVIILPGLTSIFKSTACLLKKFMDANGTVIVLEPFPRLVDGETSGELEDLFKTPGVIAANSVKTAIRALESVLPRRVSFKDLNGEEIHEIIYMLRENEDCYTLFAVNTDRARALCGKAEIGVEGTPEEWAPLTGQFHEIEFLEGRGCVSFQISLPPAGSKLFIVRKKDVNGCETSERAIDFWNPAPLGAPRAVLARKAPFKRTMPNILVLDMCRFQIGGGEQSEIMEVWLAQREIRKQLGMRQIFQNELPQRYLWVNERYARDLTPVTLTFKFNVIDIPKGNMGLVVEDSHKYTIRFNGREARHDGSKYFLDHSFDWIDLGLPEQGINEVVLSCDYASQYELENIYIIGDFAVNSGRDIVKEPEFLRLGDWGAQGYPYYCGSMVYSFELDYLKADRKKTLLEMGGYDGVTASVSVNGESAVHFPWKIEPVDVTAALRDGINHIDVEISGSMRNLIGPLHDALTPDKWVDWAPFRREGAYYSGEYSLYPYGLTSPVKLYESK